MNYLQKITLKEESRLHLANAIVHQNIAARLRHHLSTQLGDNGWPNRYPISAGICEHWPEWAKDAVVASVHKAQSELDLSLAKHKQAGCRLATWLKMKFEAGL
jgi:hypothetical protein